MASPLRHSFPLRQALPEYFAAAMDNFKAVLAEHRRLQQEMTKYTGDMHHAVELLPANLRAMQACKMDESVKHVSGAPSPFENRTSKIN
jgi:hypothetical protein